MHLNLEYFPLTLNYSNLTPTNLLNMRVFYCSSFLQMKRDYNITIKGRCLIWDRARGDTSINIHIWVVMYLDKDIQEQFTWEDTSQPVN